MSIIEINRSHERSPHDSPGFHEAWWRYLSPKFDIPYRKKDLLIHRRKFLKGLVTFNEARIFGWNQAHLWVQDLTTERVQELEILQKEYGWDYCRMIWAEERRAQQRFELLEEAGYEVLQREASHQYMVELTQGFEYYLGTLSKDARKHLKKQIRLGKSLNPQLVTVAKESEILPFFEKFFSHHIPYWQQKTGYSYFKDREEREFIIEWAKMLFQSGNLLLSGLLLEGKTANLSMRIVSHPYAYFVLTINTGLYNEFSPGLIGFAMRVEEMANQGIQYCNLGSGDYGHKVRHSNRIRTCKEAFILNPSTIKAKVYRQWIQHRYPSLKEEYNRHLVGQS